MTAPLIAILTDFGLQDPFAGILKGVIANLAPGVPLVDLTHEIPPGDVRQAAVDLWQSAPYFPPGTIFLAVVDPGVGTSRRPMVLQIEHKPSSMTQWFVGPDNGLFTFLLHGYFQAWTITNPDYMLPGPCKTFHGRDIFAPAAAHLANGVPGSNFGPVLSDPVKLATPRLELSKPEGLTGEVLFADKFGNLLTSLGRFERMEDGKVKFEPWLPGLDGADMQAHNMQVRLPDGSLLPLVSTFGDIIPGRYAALIGSSGLLEIASNQTSAASLLKLKRGEIILLLYQ
jgi:S-adenosylmethionine hydrolase